MKGLLLKDFYNMSGQKKIIVFLGLFYTGFALFTESGSIMMQLLVLVCGLLAVSAFSYDEFAKWDSYALSLPVTRKEIVAARYVFAAIMVGVGVLAAITLGGISLSVRQSIGMAELATSVLVSAAVILLLLSFALPVCYKFGLEKGRLVTTVLMISLSFLGMAVPGVVSSWIGKRGQSIALSVVGLLLPAGAVAFALSYVISARIYEKKDF